MSGRRAARLLIISACASSLAEFLVRSGWPKLVTFLQKINPDFNRQKKRYSKSYAEPTKMKQRTGDLIDLAADGEFDVIVHGCNCECIMGGGIAKQIKMSFPPAYKADCDVEPRRPMQARSAGYPMQK